MNTHTNLNESVQLLLPRLPLNDTASARAGGEAFAFYSVFVESELRGLALDYTRTDPNSMRGEAITISEQFANLWAAWSALKVDLESAARLASLELPPPCYASHPYVVKCIQAFAGKEDPEQVAAIKDGLSKTIFAKGVVA